MLLDDPQDGVDAQRTDELILEVGIADVKPVRQHALERARLSHIAQAGNDHAWIQPADETPDGVRASDRKDGNSFRREVPT